MSLEAKWKIEDLEAVSKKELVDYLQASGSNAFLKRHKLNGVLPSPRPSLFSSEIIIDFIPILVLLLLLTRVTFFRSRCECDKEFGQGQTRRSLQGVVRDVRLLTLFPERIY